MLTSPSNSIVLSIASRCSSECLEGIVSFVLMCGFEVVVGFSCATTASLAASLADGGSDEMDMLNRSECFSCSGRQRKDRDVLIPARLRCAIARTGEVWARLSQLACPAA